MARTLSTCTACGCTCDDIRLQNDGTRAVSTAENACAIGDEWFTTIDHGSPVASIDDAPVALGDALAYAAEFLSSARLPLVAGFQFATTEAIRAGVALADNLGGCVDWTGPTGDSASTLALQTIGGVTATLGEVAQRADVVLVWGVDLANTHPRHFERYSLEPSSPWIDGRNARTLIGIDHSTTDTLEQANLAFTITPGSDFEALSVLRAIINRVELDAQIVRRQTGVELADWRVMVDRMKRAKLGATIYGGPVAQSRELQVALTELMADFTAHTRWVAIAAGGPGNQVGAANVLAWQTGYPLGVNLAHRYPQYGPNEWTCAAVLARGEVDAAVVVADNLVGRLPRSAAEHLRSIPTLALDWRTTDTTVASTVVIHTSRPGVECQGTTYRTDGIALPLRACRTSQRPSDEAALGALKDQVTSLNVQSSN